MGDLVELGDRLVDLGEPAALLLGGFGHFGDEAVHFAGLFKNLSKARGHAGGELHALGGAGGGFGDFSLGLLGGQGRALGERAHFVGHHRKTRPSLARAGGLDRRVQREDVGLEGDFVDSFDDYGNIVGGLLDGVHRDLHLLHLCDTGFGSGTSVACGGLAGLGVLGVALGHAGEFFERGTDFLQRSRLFAGAFGERLAGGRYLARRSGYKPGAEPELLCSLGNHGGQLARDKIPQYDNEQQRAREDSPKEAAAGMGGVIHLLHSSVELLVPGSGCDDPLPGLVVGKRDGFLPGRRVPGVFPRIAGERGLSGF